MSDLPIPARTIAYIQQHGFPIEIQCGDETQGRYAVANRDIREGEVVLEARGYGIASTHECRRECCSGCFQAYTLLRTLSFKCAACALVWYCSAACRDAHAPLHAFAECRLLAELSAALPFGRNLDARLTAIERETVRITNPSATHCPAPVNFMNPYSRDDILSIARWSLAFCIRGLLESHFAETRAFRTAALPTYFDAMELVPNDASISFTEQLQLLGLHMLLGGLGAATQARKINTAVAGSEVEVEAVEETCMRLDMGFSDLFRARFPRPVDFVRGICIRQCNAFGLWDLESECMGQCLFPVASYFNHSCDKNLIFEQMMKLIDGKEKEGDQDLAAFSVKDGEEDKLVAAVSAVSIQDAASRQVEKEVLASQIVASLKLHPSLVFVAKRDIRKGEPLTHSYVDQSMGREARRNALKEAYHFDSTTTQ
ncbi:hypothetical protein BC830DRAFT_1077470 [Chytriomyces sp. MP71]|nr:hypothetical protein BC830DRAFT_1077470 [Chytriomyces sp. MP71]